MTMTSAYVLTSKIWIIFCEHFKEKWQLNIDPLVQDCSVSSALAVEMLLSCINPSIWTYGFRSMVSCRKGPTRHAYTWQIGPFWQNTLEVWSVFVSILETKYVSKRFECILCVEKV